MINRHGFLIWLVLSLFAAPRASAQTGTRLAHIGWLRSDAGQSLDDELRGVLRELGWVEGRNLRTETRVADNPRRGREQAAELQALPVALIVAVSTPLIRAARDGAPATPIVMVNAGDALGSGFVASLARPGGLLTGATSAGEETLAKQLELLSSVAPQARKIGVLMNPANSAKDFFFQALSARAQLLGVPLERIEVTRDSEFDTAVARAKGGALLVVGDAMFSRRRTRIAELSIKHRVPGIFVTREDVLAGGPMSYNTGRTWHIRQAAGYVDKILNGTKPGDLPVQQPTHWELAINLKTAKAMGITIPQSLRLRADEVIHAAARACAGRQRAAMNRRARHRQRRGGLHDGAGSGRRAARPGLRARTRHRARRALGRWPHGRSCAACRPTGGDQTGRDRHLGPAGHARGAGG